MIRLAVIDPHIEDTTAIIEGQADHFFPGAQKTIFDLISWASFLLIVRHFWGLRDNAFDFVILPSRRRYMLRPQYWLCLLAMFFIRAKKKYFISSRGVLEEFYIFLARATFILQPVISVMIILRLPYYVVRQVIRHFMLTAEKREDEFVGFGKGRAVGGLIYWLTLAKKARRYGLFGLAHDTYMGQPLGLHNWPFAVGLLLRLGFRRYIYLSAGLFGIGYGWLCCLTGHYTMMWLIPLIFFSTYYLFNINAGTWEPLAWGLACLSFGAFFAHLPVLAAVFLVLILLSHPGVALLTSASLVCFSMISFRPVTEIMLMGFVFGVFSLWWLLPYRSASIKLGRNDLLNKHSEGFEIGSWSTETLYQGAIFLLFIFVAFVTAERKVMTIFLILPLLALYYNTKIKWIFSRYTITNFMLFSGAIYLAIVPTTFSIFAYLLVIYTSNVMLFWAPGGSIFGFDLTPLTIGQTRQKVLTAFASITAGRVAFEITKKRDNSWGILAALGYILADSDIELLDVAYVEIGDYHIFRDCCQYLNIQSTRDQFETACKKAGIQYFVSTSREFSNELLERGYDVMSTLEQLSLSDMYNESPIMLTVFKLPWDATLIEPSSNMKISPNNIRFYATRGERYVIKYSTFKGWRASQGRRRLIVEDANPGMIIDVPEDGEVELRYALSHYWF